MAGINEALRLTKALIKNSPDGSVTRAAMKVQRLLTATPMSIILDKLPPGSVAARAKMLGVSRQTYYYWLDGTTRPTVKIARKISKLTGVDVEAIRGHVST